VSLTLSLYNDAVPLVPSDTANLDRPTDAIYVGGAGVVTAVLANGRTVAFTVSAPYLLPFRAARVNATGTTATLLLALYQV